MKIENFWLEEIRKIAKERLIEVRVKGTLKEIAGDISSIFNRSVTRVEHISDVYRLLVLYKYGGVYLDLDSWLVQPIDKFLKMDVPTLGHQTSFSVSNAFIATPPQQKFLAKWLLQYQGYNSSEYEYQINHKTSNGFHKHVE